MSSEEKKQIRKIRPHFRRTSSEHIKRISRSGYRRPKGLHNKSKDSKRGKIALISTGFGYPVALRGKNLKGQTLVRVSASAQIESAPKDACVIIDSRLGTLKKITLLQLALTKKIPVHDVYDVAKKITELQAQISNRKKESVAKKQSRSTSKAEAAKRKDGTTAKKKAADTKPAQKDSAEQPTVADAKQEAKKEQDKVLITKKE